MTKEIIINEKSLQAVLKRYDELEQENKELKEEIQFHNKENSNLLAERNAAQIGYDEIREVRERYRSALEEIKEVATLDDVNCNISPETMNVSKDVLKIVNEVLQ